MKRIAALASFCVFTLPISLGGHAVSAQAIGEKVSEAQSDLAGLFDAVYVSQAKMFAGIAAVDASSAAREARNQFERSLRMRSKMSMAEMMATMHMKADMTMAGPFDMWESAVRSEMTELLRTRPSSSDVLNAYEDSPLPGKAVEVIRRGRLFENRVYNLVADSTVVDKVAALDDAVAAYLASELSVPAQPKASRLVFDHPHAGAFFNGYPRLSGFFWSMQWLQLAAIEAMIVQQEEGRGGTVETVRARFQSKIAGDVQPRSPVPVELPMAPAIAPRLFSLSQQTAIILDNLNMFRTMVADVLSYPNVESKATILDSLAAEFTNEVENLDSTIDYLASALRGGIYNQGGPALGELSQSERNRSRMEMGMRHSMVMSAP